MRRMRRPDPRDGWYEITPSDAQQLLDKQVHNRSLNKSHLDRIVRDISERRFKENGQSMVFNDGGRMLDGQHRARACIIANKPFSTYCVFGIPDSFFASFDQVFLRTAANLAQIMGLKNSMVCAATATLVQHYQLGALNSASATAGSIKVIPKETYKSMYSKYGDELQRSAAAAVQHGSQLARIAPVSQAAFLHYIVNNKKKVEEFIEGIATGSGLHKGDGALLFRNRMIALAGQKHRMSQVEKLAHMVKGWNSFYNGEKITFLRWRIDETFPSIDGA